MSESIDAVRADEKRQAVRARYARAATRTLEVRDSGEDGCCTSSCCGGEETADMSMAVGYTAEELSSLPEDADLGLGCGNPTAIASLAAGETVLDLGSGAGIDCFLAAERVGPTGHVIGVDMTPEMLDRARTNAREGGYGNVEFRLGEIEALPLADGSVDVIISNCVLNLSTDKGRALAEAFRVLRPGGRIVVSDLVSDVEVPEVLSGSLDAVAGCLPTHRETYLAEFRAAGFEDVRIEREKVYPESYILEDPRVKEHVAGSPEDAAVLERFARAIFGAEFVATRGS